MILPPELVDRAGLALIGKITTLPYAQAERLLQRLEQFNPEEIAMLMTLSKQPVIEKADVRLGYFYRRRICFAALWILGGSWNQIGALYEISRQTVMDSAKRVMGGDRSRIAQKISYERLSEFNAQFWTSDNDGLIPVSWSPVAVAKYLLTHTESDDGHE